MLPFNPSIRIGPSGPERARIMIVGEAPGENEVRERAPFVGNAGKILRQFLLQVGINPEDVYLTNICQVRPPGNQIVEFFSPDGDPNEYVMEGMAELYKQILRVKPNVVVACGNYPLWALTGKARWNKKLDKNGKRIGYRGIMDWRGSILESSLVPGLKVIPTFHPAYIAREGMADHLSFKSDLARAKVESEFPEIRRPQREFIIDPQGADRIWVRDQLLADPKDTLTFDIEFLNSPAKKGEAKKPPRLLCVGITNRRDKAYCIVTRNKSDILYVRSILESGQGLNAQNATYDCGILEWHYEFDVMRRLVFDTMVCQHAANIELPKSIDYLASIYTDQPQWKFMVDWRKIASGQQSIDDVWEYNCIDTSVEHEVMEEQIKYELTDPRIRSTFEFEMMLLDPLWQMSRRGVRVDFEVMEKLKRECAEQMVSGMMYLMSAFGREINVFSLPEMRKVLYEELGLPVIKRTKTGPSCDDKVLAELALKAQTPEQKVLLGYIRQVRRARSIESKFVDIELDDDRRMRGTYTSTRTDTGRLACSKFVPTGNGANQQNFPTHKLVRTCFVPDDDKEFGYADLEKAESRVVAYLTNDPEMLAAHAPGENAHKRLACRLFGKTDYNEITKDEYYLGKRTRHAGNYMQGPRTFMIGVNQKAEQTGVSIEYHEAKQFIGTYQDMHTGLRPWWGEVERELYRTRTLISLIGRVRVFHGHIGSIVPNAVAYVPQSTVGDVLNIGLLAMEGIRAPYAIKMGTHERAAEYARILRDCGFELLLQIHDAVGFQYNHGTGDVVLPIIEELMQVPLIAPKTKEEFTIPVEIQVGKSWGEVETWHREKTILAA